MLTILGQSDGKLNHCDGLSRRSFLKVGGMAAGGLSLAQLLALQAKAGTRSSHKAIINVYLPGGPSHLDFATLYHNIGIDTRSATVQDLNGRPQYLVDSGVEPIRELI